MLPMIQQVYPNKQMVLQDQSGPPSLKSPPLSCLARRHQLRGLFPFKPLVPESENEWFCRPPFGNRASYTKESRRSVEGWYTDRGKKR